jgi:Flp pilus assembly protein TadB
MNQESQQRNRSHKEKPNKPVNWRYWFVFCGFTAFAALLLLQEHKAHLWGMALYLILILCPLMLLVIYREDKSLDRLLDKKPEDDEENKP